MHIHTEGLVAVRQGAEAGPLLGTIALNASGRYALIENSDPTTSQIAAVDTKTYKVSWRVRTGSQSDDRVTTLTMLCARDTPYPRFHTLAQALRRGERVDVDGTLQRWFRADELAKADPLIGYARQCVTTADPRSWARCLDAIADFDRVDHTAALNLPVHLVAAEHDEVSTVQAMTDMIRRLPHAELTVLPGRRHMSVFLRPDLLAGLLTSGAPAH